MAHIIAHGEVIKAADHAAAIVENRGRTQFVGTTHLISVRLPSHMTVKLQALANISGKSRNATVATILEVGLEEVLERLDEETILELNVIEAELNSEMQNAGG